jgi:hypothetical protein
LVWAFFRYHPQITQKEWGQYRERFYERAVKKKVLPSRPPGSMIGSLQLALPFTGATELRLPRLVPSRASYQRPFNSRYLTANPRYSPEAAQR